MQRQELTELDEPSLGVMNLSQMDDNKPQDSTSSCTSTDETLCVSCGFPILDQYIYKVRETPYHEKCLKCACCQTSLGLSPTCYSKHGNVYCQHDHHMLFGKRCRRCTIHLSPMDVVYKVHFMMFHMTCFNCFTCHKSFSKGDEYYILGDEIYCKNDYQNFAPLENHAFFEDVHSESHRKTPKRPRTILNAQQRRQFKAAFEKSSKPSRKIREQLAKETGLSVRVVQVWFQNQRAKMKKMTRKDENDPNRDPFKNGASSEGGRSTEDMRSSDDEELGYNLEIEDVEASLTPSYGDPIQKMYKMTSSHLYFPYNT